MTRDRRDGDKNVGQGSCEGQNRTAAEDSQDGKEKQEARKPQYGRNIWDRRTGTGHQDRIAETGHPGQYNLGRTASRELREQDS
jgi:hypothetical protein